MEPPAEPRTPPLFWACFLFEGSACSAKQWASLRHGQRVLLPVSLHANHPAHCSRNALTPVLPRPLSAAWLQGRSMIGLSG